MAFEEFGAEEEAEVVTYNAPKDQWLREKTRVRICDEIIGKGQSHVAIAMIDMQKMGVGGVYVLKRSLIPKDDEADKVYAKVKISGIAQSYADLYNAEVHMIPGSHRVRFVPLSAYVLTGRESSPVVLVEPEIPGHGKMGTVGKMPELPPRLVDAQISFALYTYRRSQSSMLLCRPTTVSGEYWSDPELHSVDGKGGVLDGGANAMWEFFLKPDLVGAGKIKITPPPLYSYRKPIEAQLQELEKEVPELQPKKKTPPRQQFHQAQMATIQSLQKSEPVDVEDRQKNVVQVLNYSEGESMGRSNDLPVYIASAVPEEDTELPSQWDDGPKRISSEPTRPREPGTPESTHFHSLNLPKSPNYTSEFIEEPLHPDVHKWASEELMAIRDQGDRSSFQQKVKQLAASMAEMTNQEQQGPANTVSFNSISHLKPFSRTMLLNSRVRGAMKSENGLDPALEGRLQCSIRVKDIENFPTISDFDSEMYLLSGTLEQDPDLRDPYSGQYFWKMSFEDQEHETEKVDYHVGEFWESCVQFAVPANRRLWKSAIILITLNTTAGEFDQQTGLRKARAIGQISVTLEEAFKPTDGSPSKELVLTVGRKSGDWYELRSPNGKLVPGTTEDSPPLVYLSFALDKIQAQQAKV